MTGTRAAAMLLGVLLVVPGCASGGGTASPGTRPLTHPPRDPPSLIPLPSTLQATTTPRPLTGQPSLVVAQNDAKAGRSRAAAEQFALEAAHLLTDVRPGLSGEEAVQSLASSSMPAATHAYLIQDMDDQHKMGLERHFDTGLDMWIRSLPEGPVSAPRRVTVELATNLAATLPGGAPGGFHFWYRMRLVVIREDGRWRLDGWSGARSGPTSSAELTAAQQKAFLLGTGWRRIPAA
ncbi:MAG: hypothetical protein JWR52_3508 [Marmoricola sp.]|nr:hypothetical protein [Marmoricola sp.]